MQLARARAIVDDVVANASGPVSVFVADTHGELVAAATMDGAAPDTRLNAQRKAYTAARSDASSTRELAEKARADPAERASFDPFFSFFSADCPGTSMSSLRSRRSSTPRLGERDGSRSRPSRSGAVAMARDLPSVSMINDRRDDMTLAELVEELELSYPEKVASFERRYPDAMAAVVDDGLAACDPDELNDLASDLRRLLRI